MSARPPILLAHRGGEPENTLRALEAALFAGDFTGGIEFDVQLTSDGVPVIFHDLSTDRLTGEGGSIHERTWAQVQELRVSSCPIPSLAQLQALLLSKPRPRAARTWLNLEIKPTSNAHGVVEACLSFVSRIQKENDLAIVVSSFDPRILAHAAKEAPSWRLAYLYEELEALKALPYLSQSARPVDLHPRHDLLTADHLREYGLEDRAFRTWTVDDPAEALRVMGLGVETIITNRPEKLASEIEEMRAT
jgi:glycerophosphoryl diester phosphodiesterase